MKNITDKLAEELRAYFESDEVRELINSTKGQETELGTFEVTITTENLDRYQEVVSLDGWDTAHYMKNPVVLWGHDHKTLPVGVCTELRVEDGKMIAKGTFAPHEHAQEIRKLYDLGILNATSVGFIEKEREGNLITAAELLEFSFVSVPANPYALRLSVEKELNFGELVTKGFMTIEEKDSAAEAEEEETAPEETDSSETEEEDSELETDDVVEETEVEATDIEKSLADLTETVKLIAKHVGALEDNEVEPERTEDEPEVDEEEKALDDFSAKRKTVQEAATIFGEVLAEARQAIEARKN